MVVVAVVVVMKTAMMNKANPNEKNKQTNKSISPYQFLLGFTGFYWVLLGFTGFYWALLGFTGLYLVFWYVVFWLFTGFPIDVYRVSLRA